MTYQLTRLAADGSDPPADATGHKAVRLDHELLRQPVIWTAERSPKVMTWAEAQQWVDALDTYGWRWRLPTVEEAFLLCDRRRTSYPLVDPAYFPGLTREWIWTATEHLAPPPRAMPGSSTSTTATPTSSTRATSTSSARCAPVSLWGSWHRRPE